MFRISVAAWIIDLLANICRNTQISSTGYGTPLSMSSNGWIRHGWPAIKLICLSWSLCYLPLSMHYIGIYFVSAIFILTFRWDVSFQIWSVIFIISRLLKNGPSPDQSCLFNVSSKLSYCFYWIPRLLKISLNDIAILIDEFCL